VVARISMYRPDPTPTAPITPQKGCIGSIPRELLCRFFVGESRFLRVRYEVDVRRYFKIRAGSAIAKAKARLDLAKQKYRASHEVFVAHTIRREVSYIPCNCLVGHRAWMNRLPTVHLTQIFVTTPTPTQTHWYLSKDVRELPKDVWELIEASIDGISTGLANVATWIEERAGDSYAAVDAFVCKKWSQLCSWATDANARIVSMVRGVGLCVYGVGEQHVRCLFVLLARVA
jgi:hypothetical protein